ncbi:hypothetical protein C8J56DRAFT_883728 [Mycena floridula]|nr:hypothetical protein C8J56DRAFT_883728 [Mycena floridula]
MSVVRSYCKDHERDVTCHTYLRVQTFGAAVTTSVQCGAEVRFGECFSKPAVTCDELLVMKLQYFGTPISNQPRKGEMMFIATMTNRPDPSSLPLYIQSNNGTIFWWDFDPAATLLPSRWLKGDSPFTT